MNFVNYVTIKNFRNIRNLKLEFNSKVNLIFGCNGCGKTSVLESLSIFSPGRGLRSAKIADMINQSNIIGSKIYIEVNDIGLISANLEKGKKLLKINDSQIVSNINVLKKVKFIWLTGKIVSDCISNNKNFRSFFDRLFFAFDEFYLTLFVHYKKFLQDWKKLVLNNCYDDRWFFEIEKKIASLSSKIFDLRSNFLLVMKKFLLEVELAEKLSLDVSMSGELESFCSDLDSRENKIIYKMRTIRKNQFLSRKIINFGVHKTKFSIKNKKKNLDFNMMSHGEQKAIMSTMVLVALKSIIYLNNGVKPILLLDEVVSGMDDKHLKCIMKDAYNLCSQILITSCYDCDISKENGFFDKVSSFDLENIINQQSKCFEQARF